MDPVLSNILSAISLPACPALVMVCLARASSRGARRTRLTLAVYPLAIIVAVCAVIAAQHTDGWGVVGHLSSLLTAACCMIHLIRKKKGRRTTKAKAKSSKAPVATHPVLAWGKEFWGIHRLWRPRRGGLPQTLAEHREQIINAMADEARQLGRMDVLDDAMAEVYQAYGGK